MFFLKMCILGMNLLEIFIDTNLFLIFLGAYNLLVIKSFDGTQLSKFLHYSC